MRAATFLALLVAAAAHVCTLSPLQRGGAAGAGSPGAAACNGKTPLPCPVAAVGPPTATFVAGQSAVVNLIKNVDHRGSGVGANFTINFITSTMSTPIGVTVDTPSPNLSLFNVNITIPKVPAGAYVLQTVYNNPQTNYITCSDVTVL